VPGSPSPPRTSNSCPCAWRGGGAVLTGCRRMLVKGPPPQSSVKRNW
jgi:hypothetical protein